MNLYEKHIAKTLDAWHTQIVKNEGLFERASKGVQNQTQKLMPKKLQDAVTASVQTLIKTVLNGSNLLSIHEDTNGLSLAERDFLVQERFQTYMKTAVTQGVGFGAGGVLLGLADLPALMGVKVKFLFDSAKLYGYNPVDPNERLFLLYIFQLAFSGREHRLHCFYILESWEEAEPPAVDWERLQIEYRDYLDIAKLFQLVPLVGSVAGGSANYKLMNRLRENVMNAYRMRITGRKWPRGCAAP